jgi:hypothetical protein
MFIITKCIVQWQWLQCGSKCKVRPRTGHEGLEGGRGIALLFFNLGSRWGRVVSATPRPLYTRERPGTHCTGGWVVLRDGLDRSEKSHPTGIRSPDRPARSESLYRLSYPGPLIVALHRQICPVHQVVRCGGTDILLQAFLSRPCMALNFQPQALAAPPWYPLERAGCVPETAWTLDPATKRDRISLSSSP